MGSDALCNDTITGNGVANGVVKLMVYIPTRFTVSTSKGPRSRSGDDRVYCRRGFSFRHKFPALSIHLAGRLPPERARRAPREPSQAGRAGRESLQLEDGANSRGCHSGVSRGLNPPEWQDNLIADAQSIEIGRAS